MVLSEATQNQGFNKEKIIKLVQTNGLLSRTLKGFEPRLLQQQMMENIIDAYTQDHIALIEAGTGTGKSLAYLIPALIWAAHHHERTVISTKTITLQEQLINKDIPHLLSALNLKLKVVLVKGMNNYICLRKLEDSQAELRLFSVEENEQIQKIEAWHRSTPDGSRSSLPFIPSAITWDRVGAESEACSHQQCPYYKQCYFFKARQQAQDAHLLIVNHHLLFADLFRRNETNNYSNPSILPTYKRIILDEAHHIEDIATEYFATRLHRLEMMRILGRLSSERQDKPFGKLPLLKEKLQMLFKVPSADISSILSRLTIDLPALRRNLNDKIQDTFDSFTYFIDYMRQSSSPLFATEELSSSEQKLRLLNEHHDHPKWKGEIVPHIQQLVALLEQYAQDLYSLESHLKTIKDDRLQDQTKSVRLDIQALTERIQSIISLLKQFIEPAEDVNKVRWIEAHKLKVLTNIHLVSADLDVSTALVKSLFSQFPTIVLCSATLTSNQCFTFVRQRLGLTPALLAQRTITESIYESPFNYQKQALLAVPIDMPLPSHPDFNQAVHENIWQAIQTSRGNAFVLFTSYNMLQNCYEALAKKLEEQRYVIFKQGDDNRQSLLEKFKKTERSVLLGTDSFWEGVDVVGDALRCVIIVKLPFKVPTEPLVQARAEAITAQGGDPFFEYAVPHAIVKFKQGFGRLIRNRWDRGCIVCLDTRLVLKNYGKLFLNSLPPCERAFIPSTTLQQKMADFYRKTYHLVKSNPFSS